MGVPVITVDNDVIVGFDQPRLERLLGASGGGQKRLGAAVAVAPGGLLVGTVHFDSLAGRAGIRPGDVLQTVNGTVVTTPEQLQQRLAAPLQQGQAVQFGVQRDGTKLELQLAPPY
jgi:S1-C subfamily serine protease